MRFSEATTLAVNASGQVAIGGTMAPTITLGSDTLSNATGQAFIGNLTSTPAFVGEQRVFSGRRKHKKFIGFEFKFSGALNVGSAESTGDYHIDQRNGKKLRPLRVRSASYNPGNFSVSWFLRRRVQDRQVGQRDGGWAARGERAGDHPIHDRPLTGRGPRTLPPRSVRCGRAHPDSPGGRGVPASDSFRGR